MACSVPGKATDERDLSWSGEPPEHDLGGGRDNEEEVKEEAEKCRKESWGGGGFGAEIGIVERGRIMGHFRSGEGPKAEAETGAGAGAGAGAGTGVGAGAGAGAVVGTRVGVGAGEGKRARAGARRRVRTGVANEM